MSKWAGWEVPFRWATTLSYISNLFLFTSILSKCQILIGNPSNILPRDLNVSNTRKFLMPQSPEFIFPESLEKFFKGPILVKNLTKFKNSFESIGKIDLDGGQWNICSDVKIVIDRRIVDCEKMLRLAFGSKVKFQY